MRICFITPEYALQPPFGGIATYTRDTARWLAAHGHEAHVVLVSRTKPSSTVHDMGVHVHTVPTARLRPRRFLKSMSRLPKLRFLDEAYCGWDLLENSVGAWRAIRRLSTDERFDIIEVADYGGLGFWGMASCSRRVPILVRSHGYANTALPGWDWDGIHFQLALERFSIRQADFVLAASLERVAHYRSTFGVKSSHIAALPYGISTYDFSGKTTKPKSSAHDQPSILYLGRVERRKGCDVLIDALKILHLHIPDARATFVGSVAADMKDDFNLFLQESGSWVKYMSAVPQDCVHQYLRQSDMLVLPSRFETLPRVLIEALMAGVPQIATPVNGIPEIVEDGLTGLLVEPDNPVALAEAIVRLCTEKELRVSMSQKSRERAREMFDIDRVMSLQVEVYRALAEGRSPFKALNQ